MQNMMRCHVHSSKHSNFSLHRVTIIKVVAIFLYAACSFGVLHVYVKAFCLHVIDTYITSKVEIQEIIRNILCYCGTCNIWKNWLECIKLNISHNNRKITVFLFYSNAIHLTRHVHFFYRQISNNSQLFYYREPSRR